MEAVILAGCSPGVPVVLGVPVEAGNGGCVNPSMRQAVEAFEGVVVTFAIFGATVTLTGANWGPSRT